MPRRSARTYVPVCLLLTLAGALGAIAFAARRQAVPTLAEADKLYAEKSYAGALKGYEAALKRNAVPAGRMDEVKLRLVVALGKTKQWDRALTEGVDFVRAHQHTVWEPRGLYWLGRLYLAVPPYGYRVGQRVFRGNDVPKVEDATEAPERVYLFEQDQTNALDAFEAARAFFPAYRAASNTADEEIQLDFDLGRVLGSSRKLYEWAMARKWDPPSSPTWRVDPAADYDVKWPWPKKRMYLSEQIALLAPKGSHLAALGLLDKAYWLRRYQMTMASYAVRWENPKRERIPYPYQDADPQRVLQQLVREYPDDPVRDQAQYLAALWSTGKDGQRAVERALERFIAERPRSKWVEDARSQLQQIRRRELSISTAPQDPGKPVLLWVNSRNLPRVRYEMYRVDLAAAIARLEQRSDPQERFSNFSNLFGRADSASKYYGDRVAAWEEATGDRGEHMPHVQKTPARTAAVGPYVVQVSGPKIIAATVVLNTDLVLVQKIERSTVVYFAADARTGAPVPGVAITTKQWWYEGTEKCGFAHGTTGADGLATIALLRKPGRSNFRAAAFGRVGDRCTLVGESWSQDYTDNAGFYKVYSTTDRNVYRPQQVVYYREVVMQRSEGAWRPAAGQKVHVVVNDPKGQQVYETTAGASEFGTVNGQFTLAAGAPLGEYNVSCNLPEAANQPGYTWGSQRFRVEEYKKPEFEVTVEPAAERVKLGMPTTAKVSARYYFGGPVPGAAVTYRVYRNWWAQRYQFPRPFDFLYRSYNEGDYNTYYRNGEVVDQGTTRTDDKGEATVSIRTAALAGNMSNYDVSYTVEADVQDASRRVISGSGSVKATRHDVAVFLDFAHGYAHKGDRVEVEVMALNPSDKPVSVQGTARVFRQSDRPGEKEKQVWEEPLSTDAHGRAYIRWTADAGGYYRLAYETHDQEQATPPEPAPAPEKSVKGAARPKEPADPTLVVGSVFVWVQGPELSRSSFLFQGVFLSAQQLYYQEGDKAKVLLVTPEPGCTVLLTREAENQILEKRVINVPERSLEMEIPLARRDSPNVYLTAVIIRGGRMYQATSELFVPPVTQLATVSVQADRARYQPGDKAKLRLLARDWQGRPLRTELSVSVSDASLAYIQKDYAPDIRVFYYGDRRSDSINMAGSAGTGIQGDAVSTQPKDTFRVHEWLLPEGMGMLPDWPGRESQHYYAWLGDMNGYAYSGPYGGPGGGFGYSRGSMMGGYGGFGGGGMNGLYADSSGAAMEFDAAKPMNAPAGPMEKAAQLRDLGAAHSAGGRMDLFANRREPSGPGAEEPAARTNFLDTAFWTPAVVTGADGTASVEVTWPDNLTQWRAKAVGTSTDAQVGTGETNVTTRKDLLVRLQAPRFFVERDQLVLSCNVHNYQTQAVRAQVRLALTGDCLAVEGAGAAGQDASSRAVDIPSNGEKRVDWMVNVVREGTVGVRMSAQSDSPKASDAIAMSFPVLVHGVERQTAQTGILRDQEKAQATITLPEARRVGSSELVVQLNPSMGAMMLDALPYLVDYPYGCIEQTVSRFVPCVVVSKALKDAGYNLEDLGRRAKEEAKRRSERGPDRPDVKNSPYTYPKGVPGDVEIKQLSSGLDWYWRRVSAPVFDSKQLDAMVQEGFQRIQMWQHGDGGWGWWPGDSSDPYMTAYVVYGLLTARDAGYAPPAQVLQRGEDYLKVRFLEDDNFHRMAYEGYVLSKDPAYRAPIAELARGRLYNNRERLSAYSKALFAMALDNLGDKEKARVLLRNLETTAHVDEPNGTANWVGTERWWWRWWNNTVETNAAVLQACTQIDPNGHLAPMVMKWLVNNRRGNVWHSTKETAMAVYALAGYATAQKELNPEYTLNVDLGGRVQRSYTITRENALFFDNTFIVPDGLLQTGDQALTITKRGPGTLYWSAYTRYFSLEEPIKATSNEIAVTRTYYRLLPGTASGQPAPKPMDKERPNPFLTRHYELIDQGGEWTGWQDTTDGPRYRRVALREGDTVTSGDLIEVELRLESKNDYDYLVFEDLKPAGCEPVDVRSGGKAGLGVYSNMELRDQKVAFFLCSMPQGVRTLSYRMHAEIPGKFHVLPTNGYAMYAPDIRCLSDERGLEVKDQPESVVSAK